MDIGIHVTPDQWQLIMESVQEHIELTEASIAQRKRKMHSDIDTAASIDLLDRCMNDHLVVLASLERELNRAHSVHGLLKKAMNESKMQVGHTASVIDKSSSSDEDGNSDRLPQALSLFDKPYPVRVIGSHGREPRNGVG